MNYHTNTPDPGRSRHNTARPGKLNFLSQWRKRIEAQTVADGEQQATDQEGMDTSIPKRTSRRTSF